jgi:uncharacterized protein (DUF1015 family)
MALVYPFRAHRYNTRVVGDLDRVVAQPYDKTTPVMQDRYYRDSPYNVVRITLNLEKKGNPETRYPDAGATFRRWIEEGVLVEDGRPAFYPYYQEYTVDGQPRLQRGFIALLDLGRSQSAIIPHEHTLAAPKQDRLNLMRSLEGNEDLIYMLYADEARTVDRILDAAVSGRKPEIEVTDEYGAVHRLWVLTDPQALDEIRESMRTRDLFIADGHHRFETSINYMEECARKGWRPEGTESFDKRMVTCFNSASGVTILATHRLLHDLPGFDAPSLLENLGEHFQPERAASAAELWEKMRAGRDGHAFGFYAGSAAGFHLLRMKPSAMETEAVRRLPEAFRELDVSILHSLILERHLGIDPQKLAAQSHIDYERGRDECVRKVDEGEYQAAFFLNPTPAAAMHRIASEGGRMPQKSTDFYPKLLTGLLFMKMKIGK